MSKIDKLERFWSKDCGYSFMHDWVLDSVHVFWPGGIARLELCVAGQPRTLTAKGLMQITVPRANTWGLSRQVMSSIGPVPEVGGYQCLEILMQSGDVIEVVAQEFEMPVVAPSQRTVTPRAAEHVTP
jgi:hypothetical protein